MNSSKRPNRHYKNELFFILEFIYLFVIERKMLFLATIVCFALVSSSSSYQIRYTAFDESYNPCKEGSGSYFHSDPSNPNGYYQCDAFGTAHRRTCTASLVWDDSIKGCNWAWAVSNSGTTVEETTTESYTPPTFTWGTTTTSTTTAVPSTGSLCSPNPCLHGECIESAPTVQSSSRRFACICEEDWFGKLCDKPISDYTSSSSGSGSGSGSSGSGSTGSGSTGSGSTGSGWVSPSTGWYSGAGWNSATGWNWGKPAPKYQSRNYRRV